MQELLGRIARLDPSASLGLRVIACFDELVVGNVNTRALLSAAASLSGCIAGFARTSPPRSLRVDPRGHLAEGPAPHTCTEHDAGPGHDLVVWLEREGPPMPNDAIILERLALAVRVRHGQARHSGEARRDLNILVDEDSGEEERLVAAVALGLQPELRYRAVAAPLFAVWNEHPDGPEDVVPTRYGSIHTLLLPESVVAVEASPAGIGVAADINRLHHSFRTSLVALRLCVPPRVPSVCADEFGGLINLLADSHHDSPQPDVDRIAAIAQTSWGIDTLDAIVRTASARQAARDVGVHHSTMQTRLDTVADILGFDPYDGFGRTRLGTAYLVWRLRNSRVLKLPAPSRR